MARKYWRVNIEVSNLCNLQCSFCPEVIRPKKMIDLEHFRHTIREVAPLTNTVTLHLMGEPLVHPKLAEMVEICAEAEVKIFLVTNGVLLNDKIAEILLHPAFRQINFSLHSFGDNYGDRDPTLYLDKIFRFAERAGRERPGLFLNYRLWNLQAVRGNDPRNKIILDRIASHYGVEAIETDIRIKKNVHLEKYLSLHFDTEFIWPDLALPMLATEGSCQGLSSHFGVLVDGTVVPCCLDKEGAIPLGNLHETPVLEILRSPRALTMLEGFRANRLVEDLCRRCQYAERFR